MGPLQASRLLLFASRWSIYASLRDETQNEESQCGGRIIPLRTNIFTTICGRAFGIGRDLLLASVFYAKSDVARSLKQLLLTFKAVFWVHILSWVRSRHYDPTQWPIFVKVETVNNKSILSINDNQNESYLSKDEVGVILQFLSSRNRTVV
jgi:hypothetical protein